MYAGISDGQVILAGGSNFPVPPRAGGRKVLSRQILVRAVDAKPRDGWTVAAETLASGRAEGAAVSTEVGVVLLGGQGESGPAADAHLLRWDASLGAVRTRTLPPLPAPGVSPTAVYWKGRIFVAGGERKGRGSNGFWSLDLAAALRGEPAGQWQALPSWPGPARFGAVLAVLAVNGHEQLFLFGGRIVSGSPAQTDYLNDAYRYDPAAAKWSVLAPMPHRTVLAGAFRPDGSHLALFGGSDGHDLQRIAELGERYRLPDHITVYDAHSDRWSDGGRMPLGVAAAAVVDLGRGWLVAGGEYSPGLRTPRVYRVTTHAGGSAVSPSP